MKLNKQTRYKIILNALNTNLQQIEDYVNGFELEEDCERAKGEMREEYNRVLSTLRHYEKLSCLDVMIRAGDEYW